MKQMDGEAIIRISFFLGIFGLMVLWELIAPLAAPGDVQACALAGC